MPDAAAGPSAEALLTREPLFSGLGRVELAPGALVGVRLVIEQDLTVLLGSLTLIPIAPVVGVDPWLVVIALLATSVARFLPSQTPSCLLAQAASENRLFSHAQAQRYAVAWTLLTLLGLALCVPYWRWLGLA